MAEAALSARIATIIADYRDGEIQRPTPDHVGRWIAQFPRAAREPLLQETAHLLDQTYFSKTKIDSFIDGLAKSQKFSGDDPESFWRGVKFLDIQRNGNSQRDMLRMFGAALGKRFGLDIAECGKRPALFLYLDDGLYTGHHILGDLKVWIEKEAPAEAAVRIVVIIEHAYRQYYAESELGKAARAVGKKIAFRFWHAMRAEDRKSSTDASDVLRPAEIPDDELTKAYVAAMRYPPVLRKPGKKGPLNLFSSEAARNLLEQEFLKSGVHIRAICPHLNKYQRPLGNSVLETLDFGSTVVTFRNCPNNAPLALWAGDPWHPLFPRRTN
jgi:hypothetical protein